MAKRKRGRKTSQEDSRDTTPPRKNSKILKSSSNALLPARAPDEEPALPPLVPTIKRENSENDDPEKTSCTAAAPEAVESREGTAPLANCSKPSSSRENQLISAPILQVSVKQESPESEVQNVQRECFKSSTVNKNADLSFDKSCVEDFASINKSSIDRVFACVVNGQVKRKRPNHGKDSQDIQRGCSVSYTDADEFLDRAFAEIMNGLEKKKPPASSEVSGLNSFAASRSSDLSSEKSRSEDFTSVNNKSPDRAVVNGLVKKEPLDSTEISQDITDESVTNTVTCIKAEPPEDCDENTVEAQENIAEMGKPTKRKPTKDFTREFEILQKRLKRELVDGSKDLPVLANENESVNIAPVQREEQVSDVVESSRNKQEEDNLDNDIAILPLQKVEKIIPVITVSDDEDDQNSGSQDGAPFSAMKPGQTSLIPSLATFSAPLTKTNEQNFSTSILRYFSVESELDRWDCKTALDYLSKFKTKNTSESFFPIIKTERESKEEIKKGDILFSKELNASETNYDEGNIPNELVVQPAAEFLPWNHNPVSSHLLPEVSPLHSSPHLERRAPPNSQTPIHPPALKSNVGESVSSPSINELKAILKYSYSGNNLVTSEVKKNVAAVVHRQRLSSQDPRCENSLPRSENESSVRMANIATVASPVLPRPVAQLPIHSFQRLSVSPNASRPLLEQSTSSVSAVSRDPRIAAKNISFPPRKGERDLCLYQNVGKDDVTGQFEKLILQWNPAWMEIQQSPNTLAPICASYPQVLTSYSSEKSYFNTYVPLHLLSVWCEIYKCWSDKTGTVVKCNCQQVQKTEDGFKITCSTVAEAREWPKNYDIALCKHNGEEAFILVQDVKKRLNSSDTRSEFKLDLDSLHDLKVRPGDTFNVYILLNIRIACLRAKALKSVGKTLRGVVVQPAVYTRCIQVVQLVPGKHVKLQRDDILRALYSDPLVRAVVIEANVYSDVVSLITLVTFKIAVDQRDKPTGAPAKVLICLKNEAMLGEVFRRLSGYSPVLALRTKQISLPEDLLKHTLQYRIDSGEKEKNILTNHNIFITALSAFSLAEKGQMSQLNGLTCIVADADLCTEAETALPLIFKVSKLLLFGNKARPPSLPAVMMHYKYDSTLFFRLLKSKGSL